MFVMVSMMRDNAEAGGNGRFECSIDSWALLLDIGKAFGWKPCGTTYLPINVTNLATNLIDATVQHDYLPGDSRDRKCVDAGDAKAWATALSAARRSPHLAAMVGAQLDAVDLAASDHTRIDTVLNEFGAYAVGGSFSFALAS